jgi:hypothetical protein
MKRVGRTLCLLALTLLSAPSLTVGKPKLKPAPIEIHTLDVASRGSLVVLARTGSLVTTDTSDPSRPVELGRLAFGATAQAITLDGDRAWVATGSHGVLLVDLADPEAPQLIGRVNLDGNVRHVLPLGEDLILVAEDREGLSVQDLSELERPRRRISISSRDRVRRLARHGGLIATAEGKAGVRLFDFSKPSAPRELAKIDTEAAAVDLILREETLWVAAGKRGLLQYDVSDPRSPELVAELAPLRSAQGLLARNEQILVACGVAGIQIVESVDQELVEVGRLRLSQNFPALRMSGTGSLLAVATQRGGLALVEFDDQAGPVVRFPRGRRMKVSF